MTPIARIHPITRILVANRGEIALRVFHTAKRLGISTVAVHSDVDDNAPFVQAADVACALRGNASADTYLRIDKLLAAAHATNADAIHPGYGFLSENADFAQAVLDAGLSWIGPPPAAMRALGSKSACKSLALANGVPTLPGYSGLDQSDARFGAEAQRLGFPLMVKAAAGGGGRGMRLVHSAAELPGALASARAEALSGFGNDELLIERALLQPRHVEVQVFADAHGHCIHLGERDCSVQRRNQKIIEEAPSPAVDAALRQRLGASAVALAQAAGYVGAGTVEFLLQDGEYFLMEMNTRLQVEHPVTEALTGLDLVEWQIRVAQGEPLPLTQDQVRIQGHAIEVRLCAEDAQFLPQVGRITALRWPKPHASFEGGGVRVDHGLRAQSEVSPFYDSMLAKIIVHAPSRSEAVARLHAALSTSAVAGLQTNRDFLMACLRHPVFASGNALVPFLAEHGDALRADIQQHKRAVFPHVLAAWVGLRTQSALHRSLPCRFLQSLRADVDGERVDVLAQALRGGAWQLALGEDEFEAHVLPKADSDSVIVQINGQSLRVERLSAATWLCGGQLLEVSDATYAPPQVVLTAGSMPPLLAPMSGKVVDVRVVAGQAVQRGEVLVVLESMKLQHNLSADNSGVVTEVMVQVGRQVTAKQALARFAL